MKLIEFFCHDCKVLFSADPEVTVRCPDCGSGDCSPYE